MEGRTSSLKYKREESENRCTERKREAGGNTAGLPCVFPGRRPRFLTAHRRQAAPSRQLAAGDGSPCQQAQMGKEHIGKVPAACSGLQLRARSAHLQLELLSSREESVLLSRGRGSAAACWQYAASGHGPERPRLCSRAAGSSEEEGGGGAGRETGKL